MRLIDKDELVDRLTELAELNREWKPEFSEFCDDMVCLVEDSPFWEREDFDDSFLRPKGEWISVEERLPDIVSEEKAGRNTYRKSCRVLCACLQASGKQMVKEGYYYFFNDYPSPCWKIPGTIHSVTHWMPLPEPPNCGADMRGNPHDS